MRAEIAQALSSVMMSQFAGRSRQYSVEGIGRVIAEHLHTDRHDPRVEYLLSTLRRAHHGKGTTPMSYEPEVVELLEMIW